MDATQPFSLTMAQQRAGTNGFNTAQAYSEFVDNSFDAGATSHFAAAVCIPDTSKGYFISWDLGHGSRDLRVLYGIGPNVCKKTGPVRGLKNYGHIASVGRFNPDRIAHISRATGSSRPGTLVFDLNTLYTAIDTAGPGVNYRRIDETVIPSVLRHNPECGLTDEVRELLQDILNVATSDKFSSLRDMLGKVSRGEAPSFMLTIMYYTNFPPKLISEIIDAHRAFRMDYYRSLMNGHTMEFLTDSMEYRICINAEEAIDPHGPEHRPRLTGRIEIRGDASATYLKFIVNTATFWLTYSSDSRMFYDGRASRGPFSASEPPEWGSAIQIGTGIEHTISVISRAEEDTQKEEAGSVYDSVIPMRGIRICYHDRDLGVPIYNESEWEDRRNIGGLRISMRISDAESAERIMGIKSKKHSAEFSDLHPAFKTALNWIVQRVIISKFSNYKVCPPIDGKKGNSPGVSDWRFNYFCALMLNAKAQLSVPASAPTLSISSYDDTESVSTTSSGTVQPTTISVAASTRLAPMSLRTVATLLTNATHRLVYESNLDQIAETASTEAVPEISTLYRKFIELLSTLEVSAGLTYT
jgi:hypothetical protein